MELDLVLQGGRVIDPSQSLDAVVDVGFRDGRVAETGSGLRGKAVQNVAGRIVTPGLIDLHTHVYWGGTSLGVDPLRLVRGGCTTLVDTGSAGPGNYLGFLEHVIKPCPARIIAFLNVSFAGIYGFSKRVMVGGMRRSPADSADRCGRGHPGESRDDRRNQGSGRHARVAKFWRWPARYRAPSRRGSRRADDGAY